MGHTTIVLEISKMNSDIIPDGNITRGIKLVLDSKISPRQIH